MTRYAIGGQEPALPDDGSCWIAPGAHVIGDARLGRDTSIWFGAVIRADNTPILVGDRTNVQEGAMLHSDPDAPLTIGAGCTIGHHAILHGCTIGDDVLIGMGATVLNRAVIGDFCLVGAGALVTEGKMFPPRSLIVGSPARAVRLLDDAAVDAIRASAQGYAERARRFATDLHPIAHRAGWASHGAGISQARVDRDRHGPRQRRRRARCVRGRGRTSFVNYDNSDVPW